MARRAHFSSAVLRDAAAVEGCSEMTGVSTVRDLAYQASTQQSLLQQFDPTRIRESTNKHLVQPLVLHTVSLSNYSVHCEFIAVQLACQHHKIISS
jgi:hypothetical protein